MIRKSPLKNTTYNKKIYFFIGTTAELIKLAPIIKRMVKENINYQIITTGQNDINFNELKYLIGNQNINISLASKDKESSTLKFIIWSINTLINAFRKLDGRFRELNKDNSYLIIHGDTVSALIGAIVGKIYGLKIVHIESGLRSFNFFEPFPEEITRVVISLLVDIHFCPNEWAINNIKNRKGIKINTGQNTAYESFLHSKKTNVTPLILKTLKKNKFFLLTVHRQEHMMYQKELARRYIETLLSFSNKNLKCVFILHKLTEQFLKDQNLLEGIKKKADIIIIPRLPYLEFIKVMQKSEFIATDGGSNQEEAYFMGKPCLILRKYTERVEGLSKNAVLAKDDFDKIRNFLNQYKIKISKAITVKQYPSEVIVNFLIKN